MPANGTEILFQLFFIPCTDNDAGYSRSLQYPIDGNLCNRLTCFCRDFIQCVHCIIEHFIIHCRFWYRAYSGIADVRRICAPQADQTRRASLVCVNMRNRTYTTTCVNRVLALSPNAGRATKSPAGNGFSVTESYMSVASHRFAARLNSVQHPELFQTRQTHFVQNKLPALEYFLVNIQFANFRMWNLALST